MLSVLIIQLSHRRSRRRDHPVVSGPLISSAGQFNIIILPDEKCRSASFYRFITLRAILNTSARRASVVLVDIKFSKGLDRK